MRGREWCAEGDAVAPPADTSEARFGDPSLRLHPAGGPSLLPSPPILGERNAAGEAVASPVSRRASSFRGCYQSLDAGSPPGLGERWRSQREGLVRHYRTTRTSSNSRFAASSNWLIWVWARWFCSRCNVQVVSTGSGASP